MFPILQSAVQAGAFLGIWEVYAGADLPASGDIHARAPGVHIAGRRGCAKESISIDYFLAGLGLILDRSGTGVCM